MKETEKTGNEYENIDFNCAGPLEFQSAGGRLPAAASTARYGGQYL
jgi:hypothetical protein